MTFSIEVEMTSVSQWVFRRNFKVQFVSWSIYNYQTTKCLLVKIKKNNINLFEPGMCINMNLIFNCLSESHLTLTLNVYLRILYGG